MRQYQETRHSPYLPAQLFALVADVERYPEFLPWCKAARVFNHSEGRITAELVISFAHITERYTSEIILDPPHTIEVTQLRGPFTHLRTLWRFHPAENGGTHIELLLEYRFKAKWLEALIGALFSKAAQKMAGAFTKRADALYAISRKDTA